MKTGKLNTMRLKNLTAPRLYGDGGCLWLQVRGPTARSWLFRYTRAGKTRTMGLGPADLVSLAEARVMALDCRKAILQGRDPLAERWEAKARVEAEKPENTFEDVAKFYIDAHKIGWTSEKHAAQWTATLKQYAYPIFGTTAVRDVSTEDVLRCLTPIWTVKPETAARVRGRVEAILAYAAARQWRQEFNPAGWANLKTLLPAKGKVAKVEHHAALPYKQMAEFIGAFIGNTSVSAQALKFVILTAARSGEVLGALWSEIDFQAEVWIVPAHRMKGKRREHKVPLSSQALKVLEAMKPLMPEDEDGYVFPGARARKPLSNMAMAMILRDDWPDITVHGFRSTFRDWAGEQTNFQRETIEAALAHAIGDKTEAAYARGTMFEKRNMLMAAWGAYCDAKEMGNVVQLQAGA